MAKKNLQWKKSKQDIYETFAVELMESTKSKKVPESGDQDVRYVTELWQERLRSKNLDLDYDFATRGCFVEQAENMKWTKSDDRYINTTSARSCELTRTVYRDGKRIYKKAQNKLFYQVNTDVKEGAAVGEDLYTCPNCSAVAMISELQAGCSYCGTCFEMDDLFPKVSNYYFVPDTSETPAETKADMLKKMIPCGLLIAVYGFFNSLSMDEGILLAIVSAIIFGVIGGAVLGYIVKMGSIIFGIGSQAKDTTGMLFNTVGSSGKFMKKMKEHSPEFSYEYFTAKVTSLAKMLVFSKNVQELPVYVGDQKGALFADIVDATYHGGVALKSFNMDGDYANLVVEAYMEDLHDIDGRIKRKIDKFHIHLRKNVTKPIDYRFSIKQIQCKNCNASFDATKMKHCPSCDSLYEIGDDDWVVTRIEKK